MLDFYTHSTAVSLGQEVRNSCLALAAHLLFARRLIQCVVFARADKLWDIMHRELDGFDKAFEELRAACALRDRIKHLAAQAEELSKASLFTELEKLPHAAEPSGVSGIASRTAGISGDMIERAIEQFAKDAAGRPRFDPFSMLDHDTFDLFLGVKEEDSSTRVLEPMPRGESTPPNLPPGTVLLEPLPARPYRKPESDGAVIETLRR